MLKFYKYHGAGNDFLLADNRSGDLALSPDQIRHLCERHTGFGADGVMLLENSATSAFRMVFYNPDGSGGMMCGNGGRCIVAFAADLGIVSAGNPVVFDAPDGRHQAEILPDRTIRLKMRDVTGIKPCGEGDTFFLNTGTRHLVKFVRGLDEYPVLAEGRLLRHDPRFAPEGVNVNFVEPVKGQDGVVLRIRTYEKGVENETLACGTGIVASALSAYPIGWAGRSRLDGRVHCRVQAAIASLTVDYVPEGESDSQRFSDIWLTGPTDFVGTLEIML